MARGALSFLLSAALTAMISLVLLEMQVIPAAAQSCNNNNTTETNTIETSVAKTNEN